MIYRGMTLVKFYAPNGVRLSEILHSCFAVIIIRPDVELQQGFRNEEGLLFYKMKKQGTWVFRGFIFYGDLGTRMHRTSKI